MWSDIAKPKADTPAVINIASPSATSTPAAAGPSSSKSSINHLILDAGPLLSLAPLRHLATTFHTTPMVLAELRDPRAREHWERLGLSGVDVRVEKPSAEAMAKVVSFAKKTGDIAVLSATDLSVIALTWQWEVAENGEANVRSEPGQKLARAPLSEQTQSGSSAAEQSESKDEDDLEEEDDETNVEEGQSEEEVELAVEEVTRSIDQVLLDEPTTETETAESSSLPAPSAIAPTPAETDDTPADEDPESDGGEWITPANVKHHRSHDLGLLPDDANAKDAGPIAAACMTGDFAVQNVLLGMGLGLVGEGGKRISKVKSFVLRCHACFKLCKDSTKRFCPSCGNPSLMRTTVTVSAKTGEQRIHLKKNFQYHLRGTKFTIPDAKPGRSKGQVKGGTGLILREDQREWQDAVRSQTIKREKEERKAAKGALEGWNDPDWLPEIITVGMSGKGRSGGQGMPTIGHGRKNPNQSRRKR